MSGYIGVQPVPQATQTRETFTATASQTTFNTLGYTPGFVDVFLNGVKLVRTTDYTDTNGSDIVLTTGATVSDTVEVISYSTYEVNSQNYTGDLSVDTDTLYVDSTNNQVGIGTSSPDAKLKVVATGANLLVGYSGTQNYFDASENIFRNFAGSERMRLDASGNLLVGKTSADGTSVGIELRPDSIRASRTSNPVAFFNRRTSDGEIARFQKDGAPVGSIGTEDHTGFSSTYIEGVANSSGLFFGNQEVLPSRNAVLTNGFMNLGDGNYRFKDLYLSGGVYLGGTGSANKLDDYEEGTWTPTVVGSVTAGTATYQERSGTYTKIGNRVYISMVIGWSAHTGSGLMRFDGLPFSAVTSGDVNIYPMSVAISGMSAGSDKFVSSYPVGGQTTLRFTAVATNGGTNAEVALDTNVNYIAINGSYQTSA